MQWFLKRMEELGIDCQVGHPAKIRADNLDAFHRATRSSELAAAPSSVGAHAIPNTTHGAPGYSRTCGDDDLRSQDPLCVRPLQYRQRDRFDRGGSKAG